MRKNPNLFCLLMLAAGMSGAATLHVSPSGDDAAAGTASAPFRTLAHASSLLQPGDTCLLHAGTYRETLRPLRSGTIAAPIVYAAATGETAILSGCDLLSGWSSFRDSIQMTTMADTVTQLFQNGHPLPEARFPNTGRDLFHPAIIPLTMDSTTVTATTLTQADGFWNGAVLWAMIGDRWVAQTATVTASTASGNLSITGNTYASNSGTGVGFLSGVLGALDTAGEWFQRHDTVFLIPDSSRTATTTLLEGKTRTWVIDLSSRSHISILGLQTFAGAANLNGATHCVLQGLTMRHLSHFVRNTWNSSWLRHEWTSIKYPGIGVGIFGDSNEVRNCDISWSAGDGITLYGNANLVQNCIIHHVNYSGFDMNGISMHGEKQRVTRSTVDSCGRGCINLTAGTTASRIDHNEVYGNGLINWDVGGIYSYGNNAAGTSIDHNWVHDSRSGDANTLGFGIYVDNFNVNLLVHHNVIWNCDYSGLNYSRPAVNITWANNTVFAARDVTFSYLHPSADTDSSRGNLLWNNLMTTRYASGSTFKALDRKANIFLTSLPLRDPAHNDFRLTDSASAIDSGLVIEGITDGFLGTRPDVGAYEAGGIWWKAGAGSVDDSSAESGITGSHLAGAHFFIAGTRLHSPDGGNFLLFTPAGRRLGQFHLEAGASLDLAGIARGLLIVRSENRVRQVVIP